MRIIPYEVLKHNRGTCVRQPGKWTICTKIGKAQGDNVLVGNTDVSGWCPGHFYIMGQFLSANYTSHACQV